MMKPHCGVMHIELFTTLCSADNDAVTWLRPRSDSARYHACLQRTMPPTWHRMVPYNLVDTCVFAEHMQVSTDVQIHVLVLKFLKDMMSLETEICP